MTEDKEIFMKAFFERMRKTSSRSLALTASISKKNIQSIMLLGNATAPKIVKLPKKDMNAFKDLITNEFEKIIGSNGG